jgi:chemotaxis protein methyltransferase CheR
VSLALVQPADVIRFRAVAASLFGLHFDDDKLDSLAEILRERLEARGHDHARVYLDRLAGRRDAEEVRVLAGRLTVAETYFFRYLDHFRAFAEVVLPDRTRQQAESRRLRILSAGCASGEEAYTLAVLVREHLAQAASWDVSIRGIDVNPLMIEKASIGRYSAWALRETPPEMRERYFRPHGRDYELDPAVRASVSFEERNLIDDDPAFFRPDAFDVIFCRNVTMYFTPEVMRSTVARLTSSLTVGGFLFLGHAETLRGVSSEHHLCHTHETFYYQRKDADPAPPAPSFGTSEERASPELLNRLPSTLATGDASWVDVIQGASDRIAKLARDSRPSHPAPVPERANGAGWDLRPAVEMLRQERFADALSLLQALPADSRIDSDAQLLRAVVLTNGGRLSEAEAVCAEILSEDDLHAGAHYLVALCREHVGDRHAALEHDQVATYLDAGFAMPRLHLGLLARRAGEADRAKRELERALALLASEDASRILLYGGGFSREALITLCRAELQTCGGES